MLFATEHPQEVDIYLAQEKSFDKKFLQISLFGIIPKKLKPGKWRLIDLSSPEWWSAMMALKKNWIVLNKLFRLTV